jgi:hypothetical protein
MFCLHCHHTVHTHTPSQIPIYAGATGPLNVPDATKCKHNPTRCHGVDGLGDAPDMYPQLMPEDYNAAVEGCCYMNDDYQTYCVCISGVSAAEAIVSICRQYPGEV